MVKFDLPSVDHLVEGVHYRVVDWSFAEGRERDRGLETNMPSRGMASTFADAPASSGPCAEGEKMVFGVCRKPGQKADDDKDFDSGKKTKDEEDLEAQAKKQGSDVKNNKMITDVKSGKKLGWAIKNGKPVLVEWGSVAGEKKVGTGAKAPKAPKAPPRGATQSGVSDASRAGQLEGNARAMAAQTTDAGRAAQEANRRRLLTQTRSS
jgi:hypothetical protein